MKIRQLKLYLLVLGLIFVVVIVALGGGFFGQRQPWFLQWQHRVFSSLCHQIPSRSFWINGQPMAVCSRCFGIYSGFLLGWLLLPLLGMVELKYPMVLNKLLLGTLAINFVDFIGNLFGFWQNTLISRWGLGALLGLAAAVFFTGIFFIKTTTQKKEYYGRVAGRVS